MNIYYVYAYLRKNDSINGKAGTPYYIGKGKNDRAYSNHHKIHLPKDPSLIVILESNLSELGAFALERRMIRWWGRQDTQTGILLNLTDGGEGATGIHNRKLSEETKLKISSSHKGKPKSKWSQETKEKVGLSRRGKKHKIDETFINAQRSRKDRQYIFRKDNEEFIGSSKEFSIKYNLKYHSMIVTFNCRPSYLGWTREKL